MTTLTKEAIASQQADRPTYSIVLSFAEIDEYLPSRLPQEANAISGVNRPVTPAQHRKIQEYLEQDPDWSLPPLTLAVSSDHLAFQPLASGATGHVTISSTDTQEQLPVLIVDGQHRRQAIHDLLAQHLTTNPDRYRELSQRELNAVIYVEDQPIQIRQMFATMGLAKPIDRNTRQQFDSKDPFSNAAHHAIANSRLLQPEGRVNQQRPRIGPNSDCLLTHDNLKEISVTLALGLMSRAPATNHKKSYLAPAQQTILCQNIVTFLDDFLPSASQNYADIIEQSTGILPISIIRQNHWDLHIEFVRLIAGCYHNWSSSDNDPEPLARYMLKSIDYRRINTTSESFMTELELLHPDSRRPVTKNDPNWQRVAEYICQEARNADREPPVS